MQMSTRYSCRLQPSKSKRNPYVKERSPWINTFGLLNLLLASSRANLNCLVVQIAPFAVHCKGLSKRPLRTENKVRHMRPSNRALQGSTVALQNALTLFVESLLLEFSWKCARSTWISKYATANPGPGPSCLVYGVAPLSMDLRQFSFTPVWRGDTQPISRNKKQSQL
jgi:hypothetical protein